MEHAASVRASPRLPRNWKPYGLRHRNPEGRALAAQGSVVPDLAQLEGMLTGLEPGEHCAGLERHAGRHAIHRQLVTGNGVVLGAPGDPDRGPIDACSEPFGPTRRVYVG